MRTMWNEFPDEIASDGTSFADVSTQFMFGESILVAPKLAAPSDLLRSFQKHQVSYLLPESEQWFDYLTGKLIE